MTAADAALKLQRRNIGKRARYPLAASTTIFGNTMVMLDSAGFARPAAASLANKGVKGVARQTAINAGSAGAEWVEVEGGEFLFNGSSLTQAMVGSRVFATDDNTLAATGTNRPAVGPLMEFVSSSLGWVEIDADYKAPG